METTIEKINNKFYKIERKEINIEFQKIQIENEIKNIKLRLSILEKQKTDLSTIKEAIVLEPKSI